MRMQTKHRTPLTCGIAHVSIAIQTACVPTLCVFVHVAQHTTSHNKPHRSWLAILNRNKHAIIQRPLKTRF